MSPLIYPSTRPLRIGVLLAPPPVQLLDLAPVDLFYMLGKEYLNDIPILPQPIKDLGMDKIEILYIANAATNHHHVATLHSQQDDDSTAATSTLPFASLTASLNLQITRSLNDEDVQPGMLSILLIPGPDPTKPTPEEYRTFIRAHAENGQTDIITVCTGIYPACYSGICNGRTVTGPRGLLPDLRKKFPGVSKFESKRWNMDRLPSSTCTIVDSKSLGGLSDSERPAELWTAAGITNGNDCLAAYIRTHFNHELGEIVLRMAEVGDRSQEYGHGLIREQAWWMATILKALFKRLWR